MNKTEKFGVLLAFLGMWINIIGQEYEPIVSIIGAGIFGLGIGFFFFWGDKK